MVATIGAMDGTPRLLTDVRFSERRRGYDPEEVDNFLEKVSAAVAQLQEKLRQATITAEEADARVAAAQRAQAAAEQELEVLRATGSNQISVAPAPADSAADVERASSILLMAQRTADATIEEARTKAASILRDSESEADRVRSEAQEAASAAVHDLEGRREELRADVDALQAWLEEQRRQLRSGIEALQQLVDDPAVLNARALPLLRSTRFEQGAAGEPHPGPEEVVEAGPPTQLVEAAELFEEVEETSGPIPVSPVEPAPIQASAPPEPQPDAVEVPVPPAPEPPAPPAPPAPPSSVPAGGPAVDADPLGPADEEADAAMRAFFENDFGDDDRHGPR